MFKVKNTISYCVSREGLVLSFDFEHQPITHLFIGGFFGFKK